MVLKSVLLGMLALGVVGGAVATPVHVCTMPLPPQTMLDANKQPDGYATRILQTLATKLNWQLETRYMPWLRVVEDAKRGKCDVVYTVLKRRDYEDIFIFPKHAVLDQANVLVTRRGSGIRYDGDLAAFMRKYAVGLYRDKAIDDNFESLRRQPWARVEQTATPRQNLRKLLAGRFDAAIENSLTAVHELRGLDQLDEVEILMPPLNVTPAYIVFPKAGQLNQAAVDSFDHSLSAYKQSPDFAKLTQFYLGKP